MRKRLYSCVKIIYLSIEQFLNDRIPVRASALTYSTLLSIIPILALLFAIARGFGFDALMEQQIKSGVMSQQSELVFSWVNSYLQHAQSGIFIGVGLIMLLFTILMLIDNIERSFNAIWQVKRPRTVFRQITDYFSMLLLLPLLIVISSGLTIVMTTYVKDLETFLLLGPMLKFLVCLVPYALTWGMFIALYVFMPNTKVKLSHAWFPGILAGSAFQAFQYFYVNSQIWISNYNAIYGSFAAIPMFLLWTQVSWTICLFGAEMSYVSQNLSSFSFGKETAHISRRYHDFFCAIVLSAICKRFEHEQQPYTAEELTGFILRLLPEEALNKPVREFSGGMRRRTAILRAILAPSDLVLMDEPFTGLDHETKLSAIRMIREFCDGKLFIAATHAEEDPKLLGAKVIQL